MHIPDGLLSAPVIVITYAITVLAVLYASKKLRNFPEERIPPLLGLFAAGIFAAQMVNFPIIGGGVSGHLLGGATLVAIILGPPHASVIVMTSVLLIQTLLFGDGGITAIGANILNMGSWGLLWATESTQGSGGGSTRPWPPHSPHGSPSSWALPSRPLK